MTLAPTLAMRGNARRRELMAKVRARTEIIAAPCSWCGEDCMIDGPEWMSTDRNVCYSCAEMACRS